MSTDLVDIPGTKDCTRRKEIPGEKTWKVKTAKRSLRWLQRIYF